MAIQYRAEIGFGGGHIKDKVFATEEEAKAWAYKDEGAYLSDVEYIEIHRYDGDPFKKGEDGMKLHKKVADILAIINHMDKGLANCESDDEEFYNTKFKIGFGNTEAELYCCANFFNAFEGALGNLLCAVIEEEGLEGEPYNSLYKQYEKYNKW